MKWILWSALALAIVAVALVGLTVSLLRSARQGAAFYVRGIAELQRQEDAHAVTSFDAALREHLWSDLRVRALEGRGEARQALGDSTGAMRDYDEAIGLSPQQAGLYAWRGALEEEQGDVTAALEDYREALQRDPNLDGILNRRGRLRLQANMLDEAIADFSEAIRANPRDASSYALRAVAFVRKGNFDAASASFDAALQVEHDVAWIYSERGQLYEKEKHFPQALADYSEAIRLEPKSAKAWGDRARVYHAARRPEEEIADLAEMTALEPRNDFALEHLALAYAATGAKKKALAVFDDWVRFTQSQKARDGRLRFLLNTGDYQRALRDLRETADAGESIAQSEHRQLAWLLATCPDPAFRDGRGAVVEATKACAATHWMNAQSLDVLAAAQAEAGDFPEAVRAERRALEVQRVDPAFEERLALYLKGSPYHEPEPAPGAGQKQRPPE